MVIGGNGSLTGGLRLAELGVKVAGVPATIDNDVWGTDTAIGVDTALNSAVEALADGETGVMVGIRSPRIERVPLEEVVGKEQPLDSDLYRMAEVLAELPE